AARPALATLLAAAATGRGPGSENPMETTMINSVATAARSGKSGWQRLALRIGRWSLAIGLALTATLLVAGQLAKARLRAQHPPIGQLVDMGGYRLHVCCQGSGGPPVLPEAGGGEPGLGWALVQPNSARQARVCMYDRAGLGWSEP